MNLKTVLMLALALILTCGGVATAADRPHDGKVIGVDREALTITVQGEKNDQWTLYWTESTKLKGDLAIEEVKVGDKVHFDFVDKDGKMWLTELKRTDKAKD
jgi:Cu/Ag efflux protein CusF